MKKAKKIASLVVASALLTSSFAAITSVNAAEVDSSAQTASADSTFVIRSATVLCSTHSTGLTIQSKKTFPQLQRQDTQQFRLLPFSSQRTIQPQAM